MVRKIISQQPVTYAEALEILRERLKEEGSDIQYATLNYLERFTKCEKDLAVETYRKLKEELKLSDEICIMLVNILPQTPEEVRTILASEEITLTSEEINKILEILSECIKLQKK